MRSPLPACVSQGLENPCCMDRFLKQVACPGSFLQGSHSAASQRPVTTAKGSMLFPGLQGELMPFADLSQEPQPQIRVQETF